MDQLDIAWFLLGRKACLDHVNAFGWNLPFFCWPKMKAQQPVRLDCLRWILENSAQDFEALDTAGWSVLHRAAAFATPEEVLELVKHGADPRTNDRSWGWNAMHHAVYFGNFANFTALLPL